MTFLFLRDIVSHESYVTMYQNFM